MSDVKGMVQFGDRTYRIVKVRPGTYEAVRILDEFCIGTFQTIPGLKVQAGGTDEAVLRAVAMMAMRQAKMVWLRLEAVTPNLASAPVVLDRKLRPV